jgi:hypothetical protein
METVARLRPISPSTLVCSHLCLKWSPYVVTNVNLGESGYSVTQRNIIPGCANLVSMVTDFTWSFMSDYTRNRIWWMVGPIVSTPFLSPIETATDTDMSSTLAVHNCC